MCTYTIGRSPRRRCSQRWEWRGCHTFRSEVEIAVGSRTRCFAGPSNSPSGIADVPRFVKAHWGCSGRFDIAARTDAAKVVTSQRPINLGSRRRVACVPCVRLVVQFDKFHHSKRRTPREQFVSERSRRSWLDCAPRWGVRFGEDLSCWFREHGFPGAQPGNHFSARAQERVLQQASAVDARVALSESVFVTVALHMGRHEHVEGAVPATGPTRAAPCSRGRLPIAGPVPSASWKSLDSVNLEDIFLERVPVLRSCPHFMRGRLRQSFDLALRERHRAHMAGDQVAQNRAWKLFGLIPRLLLHRPRGAGSVGRDELAMLYFGPVYFSTLPQP